MSLQQTRCSATPMAVTRLAGSRAARLRNNPFTLENIFSMGVLSGLHGGNGSTLVPYITLIIFCTVLCRIVIPFQVVGSSANSVTRTATFEPVAMPSYLASRSFYRTPLLPRLYNGSFPLDRGPTWFRCHCFSATLVNGSPLSSGSVYRRGAAAGTLLEEQNSRNGSVPHRQRVEIASHASIPSPKESRHSM